VNANGKSGAQTIAHLSRRAPMLQPLPFTAQETTVDLLRDRAGAPASPPPAAARPAAGLEQRASADERRQAEPRPAAGA
jgi:hypothetical protein